MDLSVIGAAIAALSGIGAGIGIGIATGKATESIATRVGQECIIKTCFCSRLYFTHRIKYW